MIRLRVFTVTPNIPNILLAYTAFEYKRSKRPLPHYKPTRSCG